MNGRDDYMKYDKKISGGSSHYFFFHRPMGDCHPFNDSFAQIILICKEIPFFLKTVYDLIGC
jgi:hypothetical protein